MNISTQAILTFWFGQWPYNSDAAQARAPQWFVSNTEQDQAIESLFKQEIEELITQSDLTALAGQFSDDDDKIAAILLTDQFTRNVYRGEARAFSGDPLALMLCQSLIKDQRHLSYPYDVACFICMPLQHSEDKATQQLSVDTFETMYHHFGVDDETRAKAKGTWEFAKKHKLIIDQFGRYPHRNQALARPNTDAEQIYLNGGAERFGQ